MFEYQVILLGLAVVAFFAWVYRSRAYQTKARALALTKSGIQALVKDTKSRVYSINQHYLFEIALVCARQCRSDLVSYFYMRSKQPLDLYKLLRVVAAEDADALTMIHQQLVMAGIMTVGEVCQLEWTDQDPLQRHATCCAIVDLILDQGRAKQDMLCIRDLIVFCQTYDLKMPLEYLRVTRLA